MNVRFDASCDGCVNKVIASTWAERFDNTVAELTDTPGFNVKKAGAISCNGANNMGGNEEDPYCWIQVNLPEVVVQLLPNASAKADLLKLEIPIPVPSPKLKGSWGFLSLGKEWGLSMLPPPSE